MIRTPAILVSPDFEPRGKEHADDSLSLSHRYLEAVIAAGGLHLAMPPTTQQGLIAESVRRCEGVLLTGGDDIEPELYDGCLPARARKTVESTPDGGRRDLRELLLIDEVFRQRKPLLAICRGHQMLNVALGGTLLADIPSQKARAIDHRRTDRRNEIVHEVRLTQGSMLAKITGGQTLGVNSTHHQAIARVPAPLRVTAVSSDGVVEWLELKPAAAPLLPWLISVQFHPERLVDRYPVHQGLFNAFIQACIRMDS